MKHLRITGNVRSASYSVAIIGENRMKPDEDTHDTVMQILRLRMRWQFIDDQLQRNSTFDYSFPFSF